jgi:hypothetical protein
MDNGRLGDFNSFMLNKSDKVKFSSVLNIARAEFLLIDEKDPDKLLDAIYTWYIKHFGEKGL